MKSKRNYLVVAGDLRRSRKIGNRKLIQENLKRALRHVNKEFARSVVSDFRVVGGDGFQGMLRDAGSLLEIYYRLFEKIQHPFYFSVGIGELSTRVSRNIEEIDGRAFHLARDALDEAKRKGLWVGIKGDFDGVDVWVCIWNLLADRMWGWTDRQRDVVIYYRKLRDEPGAITRCARKFGVSERNIYKLLQTSGYWLTEYGEEVVNRFLNKIWFNMQIEPK